MNHPAQALDNDAKTGAIYPAFKDALAKGLPTAANLLKRGILMKLGKFGDDYKIFDPSNPANPVAIPARADFGPLRLASEGGPKPKLPWIDLAIRINQEMNDKNAGSRSGDIVLLMNTETGYIAVNEASPSSFPSLFRPRPSQ